MIRLCMGSFLIHGKSLMNCNESVKVIFAINELQLYNID